MFCKMHNDGMNTVGALQGIGTGLTAVHLSVLIPPACLHAFYTLFVTTFGQTLGATPNDFISLTDEGYCGKSSTQKLTSRIMK